MCCYFQLGTVLKQVYRSLVFHAVFLHHMHRQELDWSSTKDGLPVRATTFEHEAYSLEREVGNTLCTLTQIMERQNVVVDENWLEEAKGQPFTPSCVGQVPSGRASMDRIMYIILNTFDADFYTFTLEYIDDNKRS